MVLLLILRMGLVLHRLQCTNINTLHRPFGMVRQIDQKVIVNKAHRNLLAFIILHLSKNQELILIMEQRMKAFWCLIQRIHFVNTQEPGNISLGRQSEGGLCTHVVVMEVADHILINHGINSGSHLQEIIHIKATEFHLLCMAGNVGRRRTERVQSLIFSVRYVLGRGKQGLS